MAHHVHLSAQKLLQRDRESIDTALSAFEKDMFGGNNEHAKSQEPANDIAPDSLRYLFAIFN